MGAGGLPVPAGVENVSVKGKQILMQCECGGSRSQTCVIDLFILDGSREPFNIITFPKDGVR